MLHLPQKIPKCSTLIDCLGNIDELNCILGIARAHTKKKNITKSLLQIQKDLFVLCSAIASHGNESEKLFPKKHINIIEEEISRIRNKIPPQKGFVTPGESLSSAYIHLARAVARRCERKIVKLFKKQSAANKNICIWINRLSDYLFLLARYEELSSSHRKWRNQIEK